MKSRQVAIDLYVTYTPIFEVQGEQNMLLNEIIEEVGMSKRAIKFYEEKGLLSVHKDSNGYRNYTSEDVEILKKISVYRKLGISIKDIQDLLQNNNKELLLRIYYEKLEENKLLESQLQALHDFIENDDASKANALLDYESISSALDSLLIDEAWSSYFKSHFKPFLQVKITNDNQRQALKDILEYCEQTTIHTPFLLKLGMKLNHGVNNNTKTAEELISYYKDTNEEEYEKLKKNVLSGVKIKSSIIKYHPVYIAQRNYMKELQNKGYNDIFIPNMKKLSPLYKEYKDALDSINDKICAELGLYYDHNYNLVMKK